MLILKSLKHGGVRIEEYAYDSGLRVKGFGVRVKRVIWDYLRSFEVKGNRVRV